MKALEVVAVGKAYRTYTSPWGRLRSWLMPRRFNRDHLTWVLRDVSFSVAPGEAVGVIGVNGAGKSTLLKIIAGVIQPTEGAITRGGRVAALLELGMGFHPEFTGRQNAVISGRIAGLNTDELNRLMAEIEAFADIGGFFDKPIKVYSTGMQTRLAFAVATALRPNVLIVDEALSVGDAAFQRKCFRRIEQYRAEGMALLLVSHDIETVKRLCARALLIKDGGVAAIGDAKSVCDVYERSLYDSSMTPLISEKSTESAAASWDASIMAPSSLVYGNGWASITSCIIEDQSMQPANVFPAGAPIRWRYQVVFHRDVASPIFAMMLKTTEGVTLFGTDSVQLGVEMGAVGAGGQFEISFELDNKLAPGIYHLNCGVRALVDGKDEFLARHVDAGIVRILAVPKSSVATGLIDLGARLTVQSA